jgi:hypothetical protein
MVRKAVATLVIGAVVSTAGCLQKETAHVIYVAPDGAAAWVISEVNVHSDEKDLDKRLSEERQYIGPALLGAHGVARGLAALAPQAPVRTTVLRDERPFHVVTDGRFASIDSLISRLFTELGIPASARLARDGSQTTLRVRLDFGRPGKEHHTDVTELADAIETVRFVLTEGRFGAVQGVEVTDGSSARLSRDWLEAAERASEAKATIGLVLTWTID